MSGRKWYVLGLVTTLLLFTEATRAETWQRTVAPPTAEQIDRALRLGEQFQNEAPSSGEASTIPGVFIPPAYTAPSRPPQTAVPYYNPYHYNPYFIYCNRFPWAYQCRSSSPRFFQPGSFRPRSWKPHEGNWYRDRGDGGRGEQDHHR